MINIIFILPPIFQTSKLRHCRLSNFAEELEFQPRFSDSSNPFILVYALIPKDKPCNYLVNYYPGPDPPSPVPGSSVLVMAEGFITEVGHKRLCL